MYKQVKAIGHRGVNSSGFLREHILLAEKVLGKPLPRNAVIHHLDGTKSGPIAICQDKAYHNLLHARMRAYEECGHANWLKCPYCKQYDSPVNLYVNPRKRQVAHRSCRTEYERKRLGRD